MLNLSCLCGRVRAEVRKTPDIIIECNCTLCAKSGARWAYFHPSEVAVEGATSTYSRQDKADPSAELHFCPSCGSTTHYNLTASAIARHGNVQMGVNMRLADERSLAGIKLCFPDGRSWSGEGEFTYVREAVIIGEEDGPA